MSYKLTTGLQMNINTSMVESKLSTADILSSMTNTGTFTPTTLSTGNITPIFASGSTPTLTPTTLHSLEQTFMAFQNQPVSTIANNTTNFSSSSFNTQPQDLTLSKNAAEAFGSSFINIEPAAVNPVIPAMVQIKQEVDAFDDVSVSSGDQDSFYSNPLNSFSGEGGGKRRRVDASGRSLVANIDPDTYLTKNSRRPTGPRKMKREGSMSAEELARKQQRRERNKLAAAKCRQKREDITTRLINETEGLEEEKSNWENEIQSLLQQKEQLEFLLESHKAECQVQKQHSQAHYGQMGQGQMKVPTSTYVPRATAYQPQSVQNQIMQPLAQRSNIYNTNNSLHQSSAMNLGTTIRPSSLPIVQNTLPTIPVPSTSAYTSSVVTDVIGVPISTPSTGISVFNFETLFDGHTGLTPTSALPTASISFPTTSYNSRPCAIQQRSSDSSSSTEVVSPMIPS